MQRLFDVDNNYAKILFKTQYIGGCKSKEKGADAKRV